MRQSPGCSGGVHPALYGTAVHAGCAGLVLGMVLHSRQALAEMLAVIAGLAPALVVALLIVLAVLAVLALVAWRLDRVLVEKLSGRVTGPLARVAAWAGVLVMLAGAVAVADLVRAGVVQRVEEQRSARYSSSSDPNGVETTQAGPAAVLLGARAYTRIVTLPPDLLSRLGSEGAQVLAPYLGPYNGPNVLGLKDTFKRSGDQVLLERVVTLRTEDPIPLDTSDVKARLRFMGSLGDARAGYSNDFSASYTFSNPKTAPARARFSFPLPYGSGTLSGFSLTVNGAPVSGPDEFEQYVWEDVVPAGGLVKALATYRHHGAKGWRYDLGSRRQPIRQFSLNVDADHVVKFLRGSLFPTARNGAALSWTLKDVITSQSVSLSFPGTSSVETLTKVFSFLPIALLALVGWVFLLGRRWGWSPVLAARTALALAGLVAGAVLGSYLISYLGIPAALVLGALAGATLAALALGPAFTLPAIVIAFLPLSFLWVGNAGLVISLLGVAAVASLVVPFLGSAARRP